MKRPKTYSAVFVGGRIIYQHRPAGNLVGELPAGARPRANGAEVNTLYRTDGGDAFECARFELPSGRVIEIKRD